MKKQRRGLYRYKVSKAKDQQFSPGGPSSRRKSTSGLIPSKMENRCCNNLAAKTKVKIGYPVRNMVMSAGFVKISEHFDRTKDNPNESNNETGN